MADLGLLAAADHMRDVREAEEKSEREAPLKRALAISKIDSMLVPISNAVNFAGRGQRTTPELADKLERIANKLEEVLAEAKEL